MSSAIAPSKDSIGPRGWIAFVICFLSNVFAGVVSTIMSVYLPTVVRDMIGMGNEQQLNDVGAYISSLYLVGWTIGGVAWGVISDKIGRSRSLCLSMACSGIFTVLIGFVSNWEYVVLFRFLAGFGVGGVLVTSTTLLAEIFPERLRAIYIGIMTIGFPVGIFSSGLVNSMVSGWQDGFLVGILPALLGVISFGLLVESEVWKNNRDHQDAATLGGSIKNLVQGSVVFGSVLIGLWATFSWVPTWVQSLLTNSDGQDERSLSMMLLGGGALIGGFFSGWISNALGPRRSMVLCFAGCFVLSFTLFKLTASVSTVAYVEIALLAFFFGISQGLLATYIPSLFPTSIRATATGICFNVGRVFTAAAVFFVGSLVTTLGGYGNAIFIFSFVFLLGFAMLYVTPMQQEESKSNL